MALDHKDWLAMAKDNGAVKSVQPTVEFRTIELSDAWEELKAWAAGAVEDHEKRLMEVQTTARHDGNYSHEALAKHKALIDLTQAQLYTLCMVQEKIASFHNKE